LSTEEICRSIGADSLGYVSLEGLVDATTVPMSRLCRACFDGVYPVELPDSVHLGKAVLEQTELPIASGPVVVRDRVDVEGVATGLPAGAADALTRP
ncbi:MAG TPA: hypothetical protein VJ644_10350, partial [Jiangellaceae bacterium]|nr:hypothetical protein [Jiangellaceae bacterium]